MIQKTENPAGVRNGAACRLRLTLQYPEIPDCPRVSAFFLRFAEAYREGMLRRFRTAKDGPAASDGATESAPAPEHVIRLTCGAGENDPSDPCAQAFLWEAVEYGDGSGTSAAPILSYRRFAVRFDASRDRLLPPVRFPLSRKTETISGGRLCTLRNTFGADMAGALRYSQLSDTVKLQPVASKTRQSACNSEEKMVN